MNADTKLNEKKYFFKTNCDILILQLKWMFVRKKQKMKNKKFK